MLGLVPDSEDLRHLDALRFVAAMGIVALHAGGMAYPVAEPSLQGLRLFVDLFFIVSGFVIAFVYSGRLGDGRSYGDFLIKRVARLIPLHWATLLAFASIAVAGTLIGQPPEDSATFDFACFVPNALLLHSTGICEQLTFNGPSWSISAEAFMYLAAPLIFTIARSRMGPWVQLCTWAAYVAASVLVSDYFDWTSQGGALRAVPAFLFGALLYFNRDALKRMPAPVAVGVAAMIAFLVGTALGLSDWALIALVHVIAAAAVAADVQKRSSIIQKAAPLGQLTYSIYMIHQFVLVLVGSFLGQRILGLSGLPFTLVVAGAVLLTLIVSLASYHWFETPLRRVIVGIFLRRRAPAIRA